MLSYAVIILTACMRVEYISLVHVDFNTDWELAFSPGFPTRTTDPGFPTRTTDPRLKIRLLVLVITHLTKFWMLFF